MAPSHPITPAVKTRGISVQELVATRYRMTNSSNHIDAQDIELLKSALKDFEKSEKLFKNSYGIKFNVWKDWGKKQLENRERAMTLEKRMKGVKTAIEKVEQDWHFLNKDGGIGKGTTAYADWELEEMEDNLEGLDRAAKKKRRIV